MTKIQAIIADQKAAQENLRTFGEAIREALEELHSDEITRQNALYRHQDGVAEAMEIQSNIIQEAFDKVLEAHESIRLAMAKMGVELPEAEF